MGGSNLKGLQMGEYWNLNPKIMAFALSVLLFAVWIITSHINFSHLISSFIKINTHIRKSSQFSTSIISARVMYNNIYKSVWSNLNC